MTTLTDQIRKALADHVERMGETYHAVARACGIQPAHLYRFRDGVPRKIGVDALDRLAAHIKFRVRYRVTMHDKRDPEVGFTAEVSFVPAKLSACKP